MAVKTTPIRVAALAIALISNHPTTAQESVSVFVGMNIFSGRSNPEWLIASPDEAARLLSLHHGLTNIVDAERMQDPDRFGSVFLAAVRPNRPLRLITVLDGVVEVADGAALSYYVDDIGLEDELKAHIQTFGAGVLLDGLDPDQ